jgi:autophagy-related protein 18
MQFTCFFKYYLLNYLYFYFLFTSRRSPLASATSAIGSYILPDSITEMWEPQRDFAFAKLPSGAKGQNVCALGPLASAAPAAVSAPVAMATSSAPSTDSEYSSGSGSSKNSNTNGGDLSTRGVVSLASHHHPPQQLMVVTSSGAFLQYAIDLEHGGECVLLKESSLLE